MRFFKLFNTKKFAIIFMISNKKNSQLFLRFQTKKFAMVFVIFNKKICVCFYYDKAINLQFFYDFKQKNLRLFLRC